MKACRQSGSMQKKRTEVFVVCAEIEEEISQLDEDEKKMFLDDLGLEESGGRADYGMGAGCPVL